MNHTRISHRLAIWFVLSGACLAQQQLDWKLAGDCRDYLGRSNHGVNHGADLTTADGARFDGIDDFIEVPAADVLNLGKQDFSIAVGVRTEAELSDVLGDILSHYDPAEYDLSTPSPLGIGFGQHDFFNGRMKDLRLYRRALGDAEISSPISAQEPSSCPSPKPSP